MDKTTLIPKIMNEASHEILEQFLDCSKSRRMLHWQPKYSLEDGLRETIVWYREHFGTRQDDKYLTT
jgi:CDP-glucose 4,6-dehydratase